MQVAAIREKGKWGCLIIAALLPSLHRALPLPGQNCCVHLPAVLLDVMCSTSLLAVCACRREERSSFSVDLCKLLQHAGDALHLFHGQISIPTPCESGHSWSTSLAPVSLPQQQQALPCMSAQPQLERVPSPVLTFRSGSPPEAHMQLLQAEKERVCG